LPELQNLDWFEDSDCSNKQATTIQFDGLFPLHKEESAKLRVTASAQLAVAFEHLSLRVSIEFEGPLLWLDNSTRKYVPLKVFGLISCHEANIPLIALDTYKLPWMSRITAQDTKFAHHDMNLFDGSPPRLMQRLPQKNGLSSFLHSDTLDAISDTVANISLRLGPMDALTSHLAVSARRLWMSSASLRSPDAHRMDVVGTFVGSSEVMRRVQSSSSCDLQTCSNSLKDSTVSFVQPFTNGLCSNLTLVSITSTLQADIAVSTTTVTVQTLGGTTTATLQCNGTRTGIIALSITTSAPAASWPTYAFTDPRSTAGMLKVQQFTSSGSNQPR
jgi:hypothetical protein